MNENILKQQVRGLIESDWTNKNTDFAQEATDFVLVCVGGAIKLRKVVGRQALNKIVKRLRLLLALVTLYRREVR